MRRARESTLVTSALDAATVIRPLCRKEQETFVVLSLNIRNMLLGAHVIAIGTAFSVEVHPRDVFREAIKRNAAAIVIAHNHPSGDPTPSAADYELTRRLRESGELLGIPVIDHVVVAGASYRSLAEMGKLD